MKKQSGWLSALSVAAFLLIRIAAMSMRHPDWNANDWIGVAGITLLICTVLYGGIWLIKKMRTPKPAAATGMNFSIAMNAESASSVVNLPAAASSIKACRQCNTQIQPDAKFCSECGIVAA